MKSKSLSSSGVVGNRIDPAKALERGTQRQRAKGRDPVNDLVLAIIAGQFVGAREDL